MLRVHLASAELMVQVEPALFQAVRDFSRVHHLGVLYDLRCGVWKNVTLFPTLIEEVLLSLAVNFVVVPQLHKEPRRLGKDLAVLLRSMARLVVAAASRHTAASLGEPGALWRRRLSVRHGARFALPCYRLRLDDLQVALALAPLPGTISHTGALCWSTATPTLRLCPGLSSSGRRYAF